jgi:hypothetical protein
MTIWGENNTSETIKISQWRIGGGKVGKKVLYDQRTQWLSNPGRGLDRGLDAKDQKERKDSRRKELLDERLKTKEKKRAKDRSCWMTCGSDRMRNDVMTTGLALVECGRK